VESDKEVGGPWHVRPRSQPHDHRRAHGLLGESLLFHSKNIFTWFVLFFIINYVYFILSEEPGLEKRFGAEYLEYKRNVPRWIPRLKPWKPEEKKSG